MAPLDLTLGAREPATFHEKAAWILVAVGLIFILHYGLLPALLAGLLVHALVQGLARFLAGRALSHERAKLVALGAVTLEEIEHLHGQGHFPPGSMGPKIEAVIRFLRAGGRRALTLPLTPEEGAVVRRLFLLTSRPILFAANVSEESLAGADAAPLVRAVRHYAETHLGTEAVAVSAQIESELAELPDEEARDYLAQLGVSESGVGNLIRAAYHLLGLRTFFTASGTTRCRMTCAPRCV